MERKKGEKKKSRKIEIGQDYPKKGLLIFKPKDRELQFPQTAVPLSFLPSYADTKTMSRSRFLWQVTDQAPRSFKTYANLL